jgi:hypothetical protein
MRYSNSQHLDIGLIAWPSSTEFQRNAAAERAVELALR